LEELEDRLLHLENAVFVPPEDFGASLGEKHELMCCEVLSHRPECSHSEGLVCPSKKLQGSVLIDTAVTVNMRHLEAE